MSTPTCPICGTKFPGDPCKKCEAPAGLEKRDVDGYRIAMMVMKDGVSVKAAKRQMHKNRRPRKKHGRR